MTLECVGMHASQLLVESNGFAADVLAGLLLARLSDRCKEAQANAALHLAMNSTGLHSGGSNFHERNPRANAAIYELLHGVCALADDPLFHRHTVYQVLHDKPCLQDFVSAAECPQLPPCTSQHREAELEQLLAILQKRGIVVDTTLFLISVLDMAQAVDDAKAYSLELLRSLSRRNLHAVLERLPSVGPKIAAVVVLFGLQKVRRVTCITCMPGMFLFHNFIRHAIAQAT